MNETNPNSVEASAVIDEYSRQLAQSRHEVIVLTIQLQNLQARLAALETAAEE